MTDSRDDGFVGRWSRRKRAARSGAPEAPKAEAPEAAAVPETPVTDVEDDPEIIARLPDIETADDSTDFSAFLQHGVPEALRRQALRKLWRVNPVLANLDGLNDYDEDYTQMSAWGRGMKTLYKVGEGFATADEPPAPPETVTTQPVDAETPVATASTEPAAMGIAEPARDTEVAKPKGAARARRWNLDTEIG
jgi:hypothetical protein